MQRAAESDKAQLKLLPAYLLEELSPGPGRALRPLASLPELLPDYQRCIEDHIRNRPRLFLKMKEKQKALLLFQAYLGLEYREKYELWSSRLKGEAPLDPHCQGRLMCKLKSLCSHCHMDVHESLGQSLCQRTSKL